MNLAEEQTSKSWRDRESALRVRTSPNESSSPPEDTESGDVAEQTPTQIPPSQCPVLLEIALDVTPIVGSIFRVWQLMECLIAQDMAGTNAAMLPLVLNLAGDAAFMASFGASFWAHGIAKGVKLSTEGITSAATVSRYAAKSLGNQAVKYTGSVVMEHYDTDLAPGPVVVEAIGDDVPEPNHSRSSSSSSSDAATQSRLYTFAHIDNILRALRKHFGVINCRLDRDEQLTLTVTTHMNLDRQGRDILQGAAWRAVEAMAANTTPGTYGGPYITKMRHTYPNGTWRQVLEISDPMGTGFHAALTGDALGRTVCRQIPLAWIVQAMNHASCAHLSYVDRLYHVLGLPQWVPDTTPTRRGDLVTTPPVGILVMPVPCPTQALTGIALTGIPEMAEVELESTQSNPEITGGEEEPLHTPLRQRWWNVLASRCWRLIASRFSS